MHELRLRLAARRDLISIFRYTRQIWSLDQAEQYLGTINAEFERLRANPELGRPVKGAQAPFFRRKARNHIIFYLIADDTLDRSRVARADGFPVSPCKRRHVTSACAAA